MNPHLTQALADDRRLELRRDAERPRAARKSRDARSAKRARKLMLGAVGAVITAALAAPAGAFASYSYNAGLTPAIAESGGQLVEIHQSNTNPTTLSYQVGAPNIPAYPGFSDVVDWQAAAFADFGVNPAVAGGLVAAPTPPGRFITYRNAVVLVHQQSAALGALNYRLGYISGNSITWGPGRTYDYGMNPSVALSDESGYVVEVHNGTPGVGALWYRVGYIAPGASTISWSNSHPSGVSGAAPSVAIDGETIVEVYGTSTGVGPLVSQVGTLHPSTMTITWQPAATYDAHGADPSVALIGDKQVNGADVPEFQEVHGGTGFGTLWTRTGTFSASGASVNWSGSTPYDTGVLPHITGVGTGPGDCGNYVEVHQGQVGFGPLWYHASISNCDRPSPPVP